MEGESDRSVDALPGLVWTALPDGRIEYLSQRWSEYTGLGAEESCGRTWQKAVHPEDLPQLLAAWRSLSPSSAPAETEARLCRSDGQHRWFLFLARPSIGASGQAKWSGFSYDIDDRKRAEETLRESARRFRDYAETASDWLWEIGPDYKFTLLTENTFGSDGARRLGTACWDHALDLEAEPHKWRLVQEALDARRPFREFVYCTRSGSGLPMYVKANGKPVFGPDGEFHGYRGTGSDVTAIMRAQRAEESLRTAQAELTHMSRVTTVGQLTASIAHEVSQPIAAALINAHTALRSLAREPPDVGLARQAIDRIINDGMRAADVVARTRAMVQKVPARKDKLEINQAISEVVGLTGAEVSKHRVRLRTELAEQLPLVQGDRVQLQQVMLNLIMNALEAMSQTSDEPREMLISTESDLDGVVVGVRDSGPGLSEVSMKQAFDAFYTTKPGGLGMGLSICRSIILAHGGRLWVTANVPKGAAFQFTVPALRDASTG